MATDKISSDSSLFLARENLVSAKVLYDAEVHPKLYNQVCYHCQQSAEMAVKSVYARKFPDSNFQKTHDLERLLDCLNLAENEEKEQLYSMASVLSPFATETRYGESYNIISEFDDNLAQLAIKYAERFLSWAEGN